MLVHHWESCTIPSSCIFYLPAFFLSFRIEIYSLTNYSGPEFIKKQNEGQIDTNHWNNAIDQKP